MTIYLTPAEAGEYASDYGYDWPTDPGDRQAAINRAARYLNALPWRGRPTTGRSQDDAWPRSGVVDRDGNLIPDGSVPREVKEAAAIYAIAEAAEPGLLAPMHRTNEVAMMERVGPISVQYRTARTPEASRPILLAAHDLIRQFLRSRSAVALTRA